MRTFFRKSVRSLLAGRTSACPTAVLLIWLEKKEMAGRSVHGKELLEMELRKRVTSEKKKNNPTDSVSFQGFSWYP